MHHTPMKDLHYMQMGEYYIPDIQLEPQEARLLGKYGQMRRAFLQENYSLLPETVDKVIARKKNVDHGDSYKQFDGYMTAWFVYHLQGDTEAGKAFAIGGELSANSLYQDVQTNINE